MHRSILLQNATLLTLAPQTVDRGDLRLRDGVIVERGPSLPPAEGEEVVDLTGCCVMPGLVCAHTHLYSALSRGMPGPSSAPVDFVDILEKVWWRLDRALDEPSVRMSATVGAIDALRAGTTTLIDHHASPRFIEGSLEAVRDSLAEVGLRGVLCYEVTDRGGLAERDAGIAAHAALLAQGSDGRFSALVGAHASFTLSAETLTQCVKTASEAGVGVHIHVAEAASDVADARARFGFGVVERLRRAGALGPRTLIAHATHLTDDELTVVRDSGAWLLHNPRSNMNNQVGYARTGSFGDRVALGTDGIGADMFEELRAAFFKARDAHAPWLAEACVAALANGQRLASDLLGVRLGSLDPGAAADLVVLDYDSPTPLHAGNLAWHLVFGISSLHVRDVLIDGAWRLRDRAVLGLDVDSTMHRARIVTEDVWARMTALPHTPMWPRP